jgi:hypothetical protein
MYELHNLWLSVIRSIAAAMLVLVLAFSAAPILAQTSDGDPAGAFSSDPGTTVNNADDEDIDEWENDILKSTASPPATQWLHDLLTGWIHSTGWCVGATAHSGPASK